MTTNFNVSPYYDDFAESKNFHRVLFRPSYAVQGRELTQLQTILQNQVERFGEHIFKEGSMVIPGQIGLNTSYQYVKLTSHSTTNVSSLSGISKQSKGQNLGKQAAVMQQDCSKKSSLHCMRALGK